MDHNESLDDWSDGADAGYRSLSVLAIVGFVLGLLSPACFAATLLLVVPLLALEVCTVAVRQVSADPEGLAGRPLAYLGAAIAVFSLAAVTARGVTTTRLLSAEASPTAARWISLVREGRIDDAYRLTDAAASPPPPPVSGEATRGREPDPDTPSVSVVTAPLEYTQDLLVGRLQALDPLAPPPRLREAGVSRWLRGGDVEFFQRYTLPDADSVGGPADFLVVMRRTADGPRETGGWVIVTTQLALE